MDGADAEPASTEEFLRAYRARAAEAGAAPPAAGLRSAGAASDPLPEQPARTPGAPAGSRADPEPRRAARAAAKGKPRRAASAPAPDARPRRGLTSGGGLLVLLIAGVVLWASLGWLFQPWHDYSPFRMLMALDPRHRVETLRSFDRIVPHRAILAPPDSRSLPRHEAPLDALYEWGGDLRLVESFLEEAQVTGLMVIRDGVIVHERYRLGASADSRFTTFSLAKGVVAVLVGIAVQEGRIGSLDDTLDAYAPAYRGSDLGGTRIRDLLAMSAGGDFDERARGPGADISALYVQALLLGGDPDRLAARVKRVRPPGEALDLASPDTQALAAAVSAVYGAPLAHIVEEKLWRPLGMTSDASWSQSREGSAGVALGFCCWNAALADIARVGELLRRDGVWGRERLLPKGWVEAMGTPQPFAEPPDPEDGEGLAAGLDGGLGDTRPADLVEDLGPWGYGLHAYVPPGGRGELLLVGELGQYLWIDRPRKTVVAMTAADPGWRARRGEATEVLRALVTAAGEAD